MSQFNAPDPQQNPPQPELNSPFQDTRRFLPNVSERARSASLNIPARPRLADFGVGQGTPSTIVGQRMLGDSDDTESGWFDMLKESNTVLLAADRGFDFIAGKINRAAFSDASFNPSFLLKESGIEENLSDDERDFLLGSNSLENFRFRHRQILEERRTAERIAELSTGEMVFWGLMGGVTDITSYVPFIGQARKAGQVAGIVRKMRAAALSGQARGPVVRSAMAETFKRRGWQTAAEGAVIESGFQSMLQLSRVNQDGREQEAAVSIALTGAFSGILGGGLEALGTARVNRRAFRNVERGVMQAEENVRRRADQGVLRLGQGGRATGGAERARLIRGVEETRVQDENELTGILIHSGIVDGSTQQGVQRAVTLSRRLLSKDPMWLNPLRETGMDIDPNLRGEILEQLSGSKGKKPHTNMLRLAEDPRSGFTSSQIERVRKARSTEKRRRVMQSILNEKTSARTVATVSDVKAAVKRTLNRPRKGMRPETPESVAGEAGPRSIAAKINAARGELPKIKFMQFYADAKNGMGNWADIKRYAFGRGMFNLVAGDGEFRMSLKSPFSGKSEVHGIRARKEELKGEGLGRFYHGSESQPAEIVVDADRITNDWENVKEMRVRVASEIDPSETDIDEITNKVATIRNSKIADTPEEMADFVFMHEMAHQILFSNKKLDATIRANVKKVAKRDGLSEAEEAELLELVQEAQANSLAFRWMREIENEGPVGEPEKMFNKFDGIEPMNHSVEVEEGDTATNAIDIAYKGMGLSAKAARQAAKWLRFSNPIARAQMSPSPTLRNLATVMVDGPFYINGVTPKKGSAQARVKMKWEIPMTLNRKNYKKELKSINHGKQRNERLSLEDFEKRVMRAIAKQEGDTVGDDYSSAINEAAAQYRRINDKLAEEGLGVGWLESQDFPEGENYYRRMWDNVAVQSDEFIQMLRRNGFTKEEAVEVRRSISSSIGTDASELSGPIGQRGVLKQRALASLEYDEIAPFLNTNAFETQLNLARTIGGEVELRQGLQRVADEAGLDDPVKIKIKKDDEGKEVLDDNGEPVPDGLELDVSGIQAQIEAELSNLRSDKGLILDPQNMSAAYRREWGTGSELAEKFPEHAHRFANAEEGEMFDVQVADLEQLSNESVFARRFLKDIVSTMQRTRDIPENPDSWASARLPKFIKNISHATLGGGLAIANIADFHRSVTEFGFARTFKNEWGLFLRDMEAFSKANKMTDEMGLALEHELAEVERRLRNATEHMAPETKVEELAGQAATMMSRLNLMSRVANGHQRSFSMGAQGFLLEAIPKAVDGSISDGDMKRLVRMGLNKADIRKLNEAFDAGAVKKTAKGTRYFDPYDMDAETKELLTSAVHRQVYINQTVPTRMDLPDWSVQGWGGLFMMYRNWVFAANTRLMSTALSNPDAAMLSGLAASVGLGAMVNMIRSMVNNKDTGLDDPEQFLRDAIDSGGYLGMQNEFNNLASRVTSGVLDANPVGTGSMRYYDATTAIGSTVGPIWHWPDTLSSFSAPPDRHDLNRFKDLMPFNTQFAFDYAWNRAMEPGNGTGNDNAESPEDR